MKSVPRAGRAAISRQTARTCSPLCSMVIDNLRLRRPPLRPRRRSDALPRRPFRARRRKVEAGHLLAGRDRLAAIGAPMLPRPMKAMRAMGLPFRQDMVGMTKLAPSFTPLGQREVTVFVFV